MLHTFLSLEWDHFFSHTLNISLYHFFFPCMSKLHTKKVCDLASHLDSTWLFFFSLPDISGKLSWYSNSTYFPSLNPVLPLPFHLNCSLKNYQLIPCCQTKSLPSVLILSDLHADHSFFQNSSLWWHFSLGFLPLPPYFALQPETFPKFSFFCSLIIFTAVRITSLQILSLTFHFRCSPVSRYLYQHDEVLVLKLLFLISLRILLVSMLFNLLRLKAMEINFTLFSSSFMRCSVA